MVLSCAYFYLISILSFYISHLENAILCIKRDLHKSHINKSEENIEVCKSILNKLSPKSYYAYRLPCDFYIDSSNLLAIKINHGDWEQKSNMIVDMILNAPCTNTFIIPRSIMYTNRITKSLLTPTFLWTTIGRACLEKTWLWISKL